MRDRLAAAARLGLPLAQPGPAWAATGILLVAYLATMARDLTFYDSPELALVAHELGVGHPIGMPLHTLIGWPFAHLAPTPHLGLTAMSALFGALTAIPAASLADRLGGAGGRGAWLRVPVLVGTGLSLAAWEPSTRVEVYTLAVFLSLWGCARAAERPGALAGLAFGLGAASHAVVAIAHGLAMIPRALSEPPRPALRAKEQRAAVGMVEHPDAPAPTSRLAAALGMAGGAVLGLAPYALLPLAAQDPTRFAWGAPRDLDGLLEYLGGADYRHNQGIEPAAFLDHLGALAGWGIAHGVLPLALVGGGAFVALGHRPARVGWAFAIAGALTVAFVAANVVFHPDVPDYRGYLLGPLWLAGAGFVGLVERLLDRGGRFGAYAAVMALLPPIALLASFDHLTAVRDDPSLARVAAEAALDEAPASAILVVEADHHVAPLLYLTEVEGRRPDVVVVAVGLASSRWYWDHLYARHADLARFPLVVPGDDRGARLRRFLDAHPERRVLVESSRLAYAVGRMPCGVGALIWTSPTGPEPGACGDPGPEATTRAIAASAPLRAESLEVAARIDEARGEALWRLGHGAVALDAMVAGLSASGVGPPPVELPARAPPLTGPLPAWSRPAAIHDPARNLTLAGLLLHAAGQPEPAVRFVEAARAMGLSEASVALARITGHR